jgi:hypothetical protein
VTAPSIPTPQQFRERGVQWEAGWRAGTEAEAACRNEGMSRAARDVRALLEGFARLPGYQGAGKVELVALLLHIEAAGLPRWRRVLLAIKAAW